MRKALQQHRRKLNADPSPDVLPAPAADVEAIPDAAPAGTRQETEAVGVAGAEGAAPAVDGDAKAAAPDDAAAEQQKSVDRTEVDPPMAAVHGDARPDAAVPEQAAAADSGAAAVGGAANGVVSAAASADESAQQKLPDGVNGGPNSSAPQAKAGVEGAAGQTEADGVLAMEADTNAAAPAGSGRDGQEDGKPMEPAANGDATAGAVRRKGRCHISLFTCCSP